MKMADHWASGQPAAMVVHSKAFMYASGSSSGVIFWAQSHECNWGPIPAAARGPRAGCWAATSCATQSHICWLVAFCLATTWSREAHVGQGADGTDVSRWRVVVGGWLYHRFCQGSQGWCFHSPPDVTPHGAGGLAACLLQWPWGPGAQTGDPFFGGSGTALKDEPDWIHATESFIHLYVTA